MTALSMVRRQQDDSRRQVAANGGERFFGLVTDPRCASSLEDHGPRITNQAQILIELSTGTTRSSWGLAGTH